MSRPPALADRAVGLAEWFPRTVSPVVTPVALVVGLLILGYSGWVALGPFLTGVIAWWLTIDLSEIYVCSEFGPAPPNASIWTTFRGSKAICNACESVIDEGLRRRYARQWVFAGLPLHTIDWGENAYCPGCIRIRDPRHARTGKRWAETEIQR